MFWGQRGRKSNNCLRAKTMDLSWEIFIFRADQGPAAGTRRSSVWAARALGAPSGMEIYRKGRKTGPQPRAGEVSVGTPGFLCSVEFKTFTSLFCFLLWLFFRKAAGARGTGKVARVGVVAWRGPPSRQALLAFVCWGGGGVGGEVSPSGREEQGVEEKGSVPGLGVTAESEFRTAFVILWYSLLLPQSHSLMNLGVACRLPESLA